MPKIPLSAIILAQQTSTQLQTAIKSMNFADEIIVADTSGQNSIQLPNASTVIIKRLPPVTDFASTRNQALNLTKNDWVLFLDSDEVCLCPNSQELLICLQQPLVAFGVKRIDHFLGKTLHHGETAKANPIRLIRKQHCQFLGTVHETPNCNGKVKHINPQLLKIDHYPHTSVGSFFSKILWYSKLEADHRSTSMLRLLLELLTYPPVKWLYNLFFLRGILDGYRGLIYATLMSYHSLFVRLYQMETKLNKKIS